MRQVDKSPEQLLDEIHALRSRISDEDRAHAALRLERDFIAAVMDTLDALVVVLDRAGRIIRFNRACERVSGYTFDEVRDKPIWEMLIPPDEVAGVQNVFATLTIDCLPTRYENYWQTKDGRRRWISWSNTVLTRDGAAEWVIATGVDRTDERAAAEALRESEERYRALANHSAVGIWQIDTDGRTIFANPAICRMLEIDSCAELEGKSFESFFTPASVQRTKAEHAKRPAGEASAYEVELVGARGTRRHVLICGAPVMGKCGELRSMIGTFTDISERKAAEEALRRAHDGLEARVAERTSSLTTANEQLSAEIERRKAIEAALRESEYRWRRLVEYAPDYILLLDEQMRITFINRLPEGMDMSAVVGVNMFEFVLPHERAWLHKLLTQVYQFGRTVQYEIEGVTPAGRAWYSARAGPTTQSVPATEIIIVATDITARMQAEERDRAHRDMLAHVSRLSTLGEMAAGFAHEINQPLCAATAHIEAALNQMRTRGADAADAASLRSALEQTHRASEIIRRIRGFARRDVPTQEDVDLSELVRESAALLQPEARRAETEIVLDLADGPLRLPGDALQIEQVLVNLIRNALDAVQRQAHRPRRISVEARRASPSTLEVAVRDNGPGLSADQLDRVFEPFYTTSPKGLGLGLTISRTIIEAHGGRLWAVAASEREPGGLFRFTLPLRKGGHDGRK